jgi:hypothetical protein
MENQFYSDACFLFSGGGGSGGGVGTRKLKIDGVCVCSVIGCGLSAMA